MTVFTAVKDRFANCPHALVLPIDAINTTSAHGRVIFNLFASLVEFGRELIRERTYVSLAATRAWGRVGGRRRGLPEEAERIAIVLSGVV